jgi:CshA-type fibril repeat protein
MIYYYKYYLSGNKMKNTMLILFIKSTLFISLSFAADPSPTPTVTPTPTPLVCSEDIKTLAVNDTVGLVTFANTTVDVLDNDSADSNIGLNGASIVLIDENNASEDGNWSAQGGSIIFSPDSDFNGTSTIQYTVNNNCDYPAGISNEANVSITMNNADVTISAIDNVCLNDSGARVLVDDSVELTSNKPLSINIIDNDSTTNENTTINPASLRLIDADSTILRTLEIADKGTFNADTNSGVILFYPENNFTGTAEVDYIMQGDCGYLASASYNTNNSATVTLTAPSPSPSPTTNPNDNNSTDSNNTTTCNAGTNTSNGSALSSMSLFLLIFLTSALGLFGIRDEKV